MVCSCIYQASIEKEKDQGEIWEEFCTVARLQHADNHAKKLGMDLVNRRRGLARH